ncbi:hypothetical protein COCSUDRAFT_65191 [Coccomyxa subellipsoidea C-169]|uniref:NF-X1-type domain-containing protein n=1 Tax=Coccomyxa subellipsoidea (strain C-169) TaxID=574566 RepID=I0Z3V3_COCSC|nr:hypothetical protein COCSUDRAFT_65191 [Coccomyxa subellipsoidea C-169]EIE25322.1 hypothetical protein COCSUDRAFT_65191 [Coccomyxa subellipsoidea C-169]|eukprot:XP_005649866.1 hypothetical protein COCSUDRAFT_65191 [Coccomyxa subellipsoidea C-169]
MAPALPGADLESKPMQAAAEDILRDYTARLGDAAVALEGPGGEVYSVGLSRLREQISSTQACADVCLVCLENIAPDAAVWTCRRSCHVLLHLICAQAWGHQQLQQAAAAARASAEHPDLSLGPVALQPKAAQHVWGCPKCREEYTAAEAPSEYRCMCSAELDPVMAACFCGKASAERRCAASGWSCKKLCGKRLPCGHRCPAICHLGDCKSCSLTGEYACACGAVTERRRCEERVFNCGRVCGKTLGCDRCNCDRVCHSGSCGECPRAGVRTCPCGKVAHSNLPCDEAAPPCGATCGKLLSCGRHHCADRCHPGECSSTCRAISEKSCACGKMQKLVPCAEPFRCERRCTGMRACGRHACKKRCCDGNHPPCDQVCGRRLRCDNHTDPSPCHAGACLPCPLTASVSCACGRTTYSLPCGSEGGAKEPTCDQACGHVCSSSSCHHPPVPPVRAFQPPPAPTSEGIPSARSHKKVFVDYTPPAQQVALAVRAAPAVDSQCPPCTVPVTVHCFGIHSSAQCPCSSAAPFSCSIPCGRPLPCGNHTCSRPCHLLGERQADGLIEGCLPCGLTCQRHRPCGHACLLECHTSDCPPCEVEARRQPGAELQSLLSCGKPCYRKLPECPHHCEAICHLSECPASSSCQKEVTVRCACRRMREKRACSAVRQQLAARHLPADFDASTAVQLLECDAKCHQIKEGKKQKAEQSNAAKAVASPEKDTPPSPAPNSPEALSIDKASKDKPGKKLSREERVRQREVAALERERAERRRAIQRKLVEYGPVALVLALFLCLILGVTSWMLQPDELSEERVQEMAAERLRRMGLDL